MSEKSNYMVQLDGLRFLAVASVMINHWVDLKISAVFGTSGVNLFFVLSGFLITGILLRNKHNTTESKAFLLKQFYIRRFLRIFPLYYLVIFVGILFKNYAIRGVLIWFLTYTSNFVIGWRLGSGGAYSHLWSLAVEEQFYIFFPFLIFIVSKKYYQKMFIALIGFAVISRVLPFVFINDNLKATWVAYTFTFGCVDAFSLGAMLAYLSLFNQVRLSTILNKTNVFVVCLVLSAALLAMEVYTGRSYGTMFSRTLFSIFAFWLVGKASMHGFSGLFGRFLANKYVVYLGKISYGLYVYHFFMGYLFPYLFGTADSGYIRLLYPITTILIASISWYAFENPINNLKRYFNYKR